MIIIQPQAPSSTEGSPGSQATLPSQEAPLAPTSPSQKKDEDPEVRAAALRSAEAQKAGVLLLLLFLSCRKSPSWSPSASSPRNTWKVSSQKHTRPRRRDQTGSDASFVFLNRNPDEEAGEEETKHSEPRLQRPVRTRGQHAASCSPLPPPGAHCACLC